MSMCLTFRKLNHTINPLYIKELIASESKENCTLFAGEMRLPGLIGYPMAAPAGISLAAFSVYNFPMWEKLSRTNPLSVTCVEGFRAVVLGGVSLFTIVFRLRAALQTTVRFSSFYYMANIKW